MEGALPVTTTTTTNPAWLITAYLIIGAFLACAVMAAIALLRRFGSPDRAAESALRIHGWKLIAGLILAWPYGIAKVLTDRGRKR